MGYALRILFLISVFFISFFTKFNDIKIDYVVPDNILISGTSFYMNFDISAGTDILSRPDGKNFEISQNKENNNNLYTTYIINPIQDKFSVFKSDLLYKIIFKRRTILYFPSELRHFLYTRAP